jgi:hypothetical protein
LRWQDWLRIGEHAADENDLDVSSAEVVAVREIRRMNLNFVTKSLKE